MAQDFLDRQARLWYSRPAMPPEYRLVRSRRRTLALIVERDGSLTVRAPLRLPASEIARFVDARSDWIARMRARAARSAPAIHRYQEGETFPYLGVEYPLRLVCDGQAGLEFDGAFLLDRTLQDQGQRLFTAWYRRQARRHLEERVAHFAGAHGFAPARVRISSARTRWGSCSQKGTLSFTWRLTMAPEAIIDYVVVHELCHLREPNHSPAFWALVESILPDYRLHRSWLKQHGERLQLS